MSGIKPQGKPSLPKSPISFLKEQTGMDKAGQIEQAPAPVAMPTIDSEAVKLARKRAMARMVNSSQGRESTILSQNTGTTLGGV